MICIFCARLSHRDFGLSMCNELEGQKIALVGVVAQDLFILSNILLLHKLCLLPVRDPAPDICTHTRTCICIMYIYVCRKVESAN